MGGGFTLIEMLIVVAIIAILIAISIPVLSDALERARQATDAANERAAKAEIVAMYLLGSEIETGVTVEGGKKYFYDAENGKLLKSDESSSDVLKKLNYGKCKNHKGGLIKVSIDATTNVVTIEWYSNTAGTIGSDAIEKDLCTTIINK